MQLKSHFRTSRVDVVLVRYRTNTILRRAEPSNRIVRRLHEYSGSPSRCLSAQSIILGQIDSCKCDRWPTVSWPFFQLLISASPYTYRNLFSTTPIQLYTPTIIDTIANETMVTDSLRYKKLWLTFPESSGVRLLQANQP